MRIELVFCALLLGAPVHADPLADLSGDWAGSGWARQTADGPRESVRCRLSNNYDSDARRLVIDGTCAVPGQKLRMSGTLVREKDGLLSGLWSNPTGTGQTNVAGRIEGGDVLFFFDAPNPNGSGRISQRIQLRVQGTTFSLASEERTDDPVRMSEIEFSER